MSGKSNKKMKIRILKILISGFSFLFLCFLLLRFIPVKNLSKFCERQNSTRFYDCKKNLISILILDDGLQREYFPIEEIPSQIQEIFILAEDKNFYSHCGFDLKAIFRAFRQNSEQKKTVSGASTITMQLVRMIFPRKEKVTVFTKIKECFTAFRLELQLSKKKILELYLNNLPFGNQIEGIGSASRIFFSKNLENLSTSQILSLAVVPRRPSFYSPLVNPENSYEAAMKIAQNFNFSVSKEEWILETSPKKFKNVQNAPHFINFIKNKYAEKKKIIPNELNLSFDLELNSLIEKTLLEQLEKFSDSRIQNGAVLAFENKTGLVKAWCGNPNFFSENSGQVDGVIKKHQSGSSSKPFLYALALENGYKPNQVLADIPKDFGGQNVYVPLNFNNRYNGPQMMRVCLASSLNIPAVDILYHLGVDKYFDFLLKAHFSSLNGTREKTGLSLALGSNEVSLLELTRAFSIFVNDGILKEVIVENGEYDEKSFRRIIKKDTARVIADFLSDKSAQSLGFGNAKVFSTNYPSIFKTGTANQFQDIISLCSTSGYTVGVWMGNLNGETVIKKTGSSIPAYVCRVVQDYLTQNGTKKDVCTEFLEPDSYKKVKVCALSGLRPSKNCVNLKSEYIENYSGDGEKNLKVCSWHYKDGKNVKVKYPSEFQHWASGKNINSLKIRTKSNESLKILYPTDNAVFFLDDSIPKNVQKITILCSGGKENKTFSYLDGSFFESTENIQSFTINLQKGEHKFCVVNGSEKSEISFCVK